MTSRAIGSAMASSSQVRSLPKRKTNMLSVLSSSRAAGQAARCLIRRTRAPVRVGSRRSALAARPAWWQGYPQHGALLTAPEGLIAAGHKLIAPGHEWRSARRDDGAGQGLPTRQIASQLHLTTDTVQDHLKSVFDRTGVHSRGELVATILQRDYLPHAIAGDPLNRSGGFTAGRRLTSPAQAGPPGSRPA